MFKSYGNQLVNIFFIIYHGNTTNESIHPELLAGFIDIRCPSLLQDEQI